MTRVRGITEQVTDAARRVLRLSTIRARFANAIDKAEHDQLTYRGFLAELLMAGMEPAGYRREQLATMLGRDADHPPQWSPPVTGEARPHRAVDLTAGPSCRKENRTPKKRRSRLRARRTC
jgi:hypothetical protein